MDIRFRPTEEAEQNLKAMLDFIRYQAKNLQEEAWGIAFGEYSQMVEDIFASEGGEIGQPWAPLTRYTLMERDILGFDAGPILVRRGHLRNSVTMENMPPRDYPEPYYEPGGMNADEKGIVEGFVFSGSVTEDINIEEAHELWRFGTVDERFERLNATRQMVPGEEGEGILGARIDKALLRLLED